MGASEIDELNAAQSKNRMMVIAAVAGLIVLVGIGYALMRDPDKHQEYSVGSECTDDCGVYRHQGWICLKDKKYCTKPCGENHPKCPDGFSCTEVPGAPATTPKDSPKPASTYCTK